LEGREGDSNGWKGRRWKAKKRGWEREEREGGGKGRGGVGRIKVGKRIEGDCPGPLSP